MNENTTKIIQMENNDGRLGQAEDHHHNAGSLISRQDSSGLLYSFTASMNEYILTTTPPLYEHIVENPLEHGPMNQPFHNPLASTISTSYRTRESKTSILIKDKGSVRDPTSLSCINPLPIQFLNGANS
jgi:hypothetical protein